MVDKSLSHYKGLEELAEVAEEGLADQQWRDAAIRGSNSCHNMPQH
jgi:hypothetical protein